MIPVINTSLQNTSDVEFEDNTYAILATDDEENYRVSGYVDNINAVKQAIYLILGCERYKFPIYSWDYGVELVDLFGKPIPYVKSEVKRRIIEALIQDNRINDVVDFQFESNKSKLHVTFTVITIYGTVNSEIEVNV